MNPFVQTQREKKSWLQENPVRFAIVMGILNTEWVVIPFILKGVLKLQGWPLAWAAALWSCGQLVYWYWFVGWAYSKKKESETTQTGLFHWLERWAISFIHQFDPDRFTGLTRNVFSFLGSCGKIAGAILMFLGGAFPLPIPIIGGILWIPSLGICRATKWKMGFAILLVGDAIKSFIYAFGWDYLWRILFS